MRRADAGINASGVRGRQLQAQHFSDIIEARQPLGFFEVHAENYMGAGGPPHA